MHRLMVGLARVMAIMGGLVLLALTIMTCLSVLGRLANTVGHSAFLKDNLAFLANLAQQAGPIRGDFELIEAGVAFAIVAFLPWCQLKRGHAKVDVLARQFPSKVERLLTFFWEAVFAFVIVVVAWRLAVGMGDKMRYGETTLLLQFPVWWGYAACSVAGLVAAIVALYSAALRAGAIVGGRQHMVDDRGAGR